MKQTAAQQIKRAADAYGWELIKADMYGDTLSAYHYRKNGRFVHVWFSVRGSVISANTATRFFDGPGKLLRVLSELSGMQLTTVRAK